MSERGCYLCSDDPAADEEACAACDAEFWANPVAIIIDDAPPLASTRGLPKKRTTG